MIGRRPSTRTIEGLAADTPAAQRLLWLLGTGARDSTAHEAFDREFLAEVPLRKVRRLVAASLGRKRHLVVRESIVQPTEIVAVVDTGRRKLSFELITSSTSPHLITGLLFGPWSPAVKSALPVSIAELDDRLNRLAANTRLLVARRVGDSWEERIGRNVGRVGPVGSAFKIWILGATIHEIASQRLAWDTTHIHNGEAMTIFDACTRMFASSDNAATDLLLDRIGAGSVVEHCRAIGVGGAATEANQPFLSVAQAFWLKLADPDLRATYVSATREDRLAILDTFPPTIPTHEQLAALPPGPSALDIAEWFASPLDLVAGLDWLDRRVDDEGVTPLRGILSSNPAIDRTGYAGDVWYKGGSEPGVACGCWMMTEGNEVWAVVLSVDDPHNEIDNDEFNSLAEGAAFIARSLR